MDGKVAVVEVFDGNAVRCRPSSSFAALGLCASPCDRHWSSNHIGNR